MYAVFFKTSGKQKYIFGTNKLREVVGASQIVALSTTTWVNEGIAAVRENPVHMGVRVEPVVRISGLALVTVSAAGEDRAEAAAKALVTEVTRRALKFAPGLVVTGAIAQVDGASGVGHAERKRLIDKAAEARSMLPAPEARLQRLPVVASCRTGDGPAAAHHDDGSGDGFEALSQASIEKRTYNVPARHANRSIIEQGADGRGSLTLIEARELEQALVGKIGWLGVVHADGNGIGALVSTEMDQATYQDFCLALDKCTQQALRDAAFVIKNLRDAEFRGRADEALTLLPLVASGDDMTALVDGHLALPFAAAYLRAFEQHAWEHKRLRDVAQRSYAGAGRITASAGVAIVKPHFPFRHAYALAEQATGSAKRLAKKLSQPLDGDAGRAAAVSALDWHVHYDSTAADPQALWTLPRRHDDRLGRPVQRTHALLRRPYAISDTTLPAEMAVRDFAHLEWLVSTVLVERHPKGGEALPMSQLMGLRAAVVDAVERGHVRNADDLYRRLCRRPELRQLRYLGECEVGVHDAEDDGCAERTLFARWDRDTGRRASALIDFLDIVAERFLSPESIPMNVTGSGEKVAL